MCDRSPNNDLWTRYPNGHLSRSQRESAISPENVGAGFLSLRQRYLAKLSPSRSPSSRMPQFCALPSDDLLTSQFALRAVVLFLALYSPNLMTSAIQYRSRRPNNCMRLRPTWLGLVLGFFWMANFEIWRLVATSQVGFRVQSCHGYVRPGTAESDPLPASRKPTSPVHRPMRPSEVASKIGNAAALSVRPSRAAKRQAARQAVN